MQQFNYYAFFDVDETIINMKTMFSFMRFFCKKDSSLGALTGNTNYFIFKTKLFVYKKIGKSREFLNSYYYQFYKGVSVEKLETLSYQWFQYILQDKKLFTLKVIDELEMHQKNGACIVFVSGSFFPCLDPLAKLFRVNKVISTQLEAINGVLTGKIIPPQTIGNGKATRILDFVKKNKINLKTCFAYGDHASDIPMLELVGNPIAVGKDHLIMDYAKKNNWKII